MQQAILTVIALKLMMHFAAWEAWLYPPLVSHHRSLICYAQFVLCMGLRKAYRQQPQYPRVL